jgi:hypothetical protein
MFTTIYGICPHTARALHANGMRSIRELLYHYGGSVTGGAAELTNRDGHVEDEENIADRSIQVSLTLRDDFSQP